MQYIDLHVHSNYSDGSLSPDEVVRLSYKKNLAAIALTDHDTVAGIASARIAAEKYAAGNTPLRVISGVEISSAYKDRDIHILGLMIDENNEDLQKLLNDSLTERKERNLKMAERLSQYGISVNMDELCQGEDCASVTRAHFARFMVDNGYTSTYNEAFVKYIGYDCPCYVERTYISPFAAIEAIKKAGGVAVLAHPLLYKLSNAEIEILVEYLADLGIQGLEALYSCNSGLDESYLHSLANRYHLAISGGSDFHGSNKPNLEIGTGYGSLRVPVSILTELEKRKQQS